MSPGRRPATVVLGGGDGFQVRRIDAGLVAAEVVQMQIPGNLAYEQFVDDAMSRQRTAGDLRTTVALVV
jgi:hypothetical protein